MSSKLLERSNSFSIVLNDNELNLLQSDRFIYSKLMDWELRLSFIALIHHANEYDQIEKRIKTSHYHLVITLAFDKVCAIGRMISELSNLFHINENQISIEKATDVCSCVRYLIHLDNVDKEQYLPFDIVTNNESLVGEYLSRIRDIDDIKEVIEIAKRYNYDFEKIMLAIGHKNWKKWRVEFQDLKRDKVRF